MQRENKLLKAYYDFFDARFSDSSIVVGLIGTLIMLVGFIGSENTQNFAKSNLLESKNEINTFYVSSNDNIIEIGGKKYKVLFQELKY